MDNKCCGSKCGCGEQCQMSVGRKLVPYAGGKSLLVPRLLKMVPEHECYVEVFGGGAALLASKRPSKSEILNDIDRRLTTLYRVAKYHPEALELEFRMTLRSRANFEDFREQAGLTDVQRAARFAFLLLNTFGNRVSLDSFQYATTGRTGAWPAKILAHVQHIYDVLETRKVTIETLDFEELIDRYDRAHTFFYLDPPYYLPSVPYAFALTEADHERLARRLAKVRGSWLLSYNDVPEVRRLYEGFRTQKVVFRYGISGKAGRPCTQGKEVLIRNY